MRASLLSLVALCAIATSVAGCRCSPANPSAVTLKIVNPGPRPIYVDATRGTLGLTIQRDVGGTLYPFDDLACQCRSCDLVCEPSCSCPAVGPDLIRKIEANDSAQRLWDGVVQVSGLTSCGDGTCLAQANAPLNEPFTLELCFSTQVPTGTTFLDGGVALGQLPKLSQNCVTKVFEPQAGVVEIGPSRGASCRSNLECVGSGELCLDGSCTSGCPANAYPELGSAWNLLIPSPENMGFFTQAPRGQGNAFTGTGTLTSFLYQGEKLELFLSRTDPITSETLTATQSLALPPMTGAPLEVGTQVSVLVVDDGNTPPARGLVMRDAATGAILLAADMAYGSGVLAPADFAPVSAAFTSRIVGCREDGCGKLLYDTTTFSAEGRTVELEPGQKGDLALAQGLYRFFSVSSGTYASTRCDIRSLHPWVFWRQAPP
jgi:hypothetical protein